MLSLLPRIDEATVVALYQMLACCMAGMMLAELARVYGGGVARGPSKPKPKRKPAAGKAKSVQRPKPTRAELEAQVRAMFPAPPAPDERSRARAAAVAALKKSVRGIFCLLPERVCVGIIKSLAGVGQGCPRCGGHNITVKDPHYRTYYRRCRCADCQAQGHRATFYELTGTIFEGSHLSMRQWLWGLFLFVGGCSTAEITRELDINPKSGRRMVGLCQLTVLTCRFRFRMRGTVEFDEVYVIGGLKGNAGNTPRTRPARRRGHRQPGRGTWDTDKVPILGLVDRQGHIYFVPCANVQTATIQFLIEYLTDRGATVYTDGYNIYNFLRRSGYQHATVNHSAGEYARGEVHVNTVEGWWSLLRDHLRIHRGVSKVYLPLYVMRFEFLANHRGQTRWAQMLALGSLACQADGQRLRRLVREQQVHTVCPVLGLLPEGV